MVTDETPSMHPEEKLNIKQPASEIPANESFSGGLMLQKLVNLTSSVENGSGNEDQSQTSHKILEENV